MISTARVPHIRQRLGSLDMDTAVLLALVALALVSRVLYVLINPPFLSPDETGHYEYVASLYQNWGGQVRGGESHQPFLYYWLVLPAFALAAREPPDLEVYALAVGQASMSGLLAVRFASALMSAATVPIAYWTARSICPKDRFVCLGTAAFVAMAPMYSSIGASINNDTLANVLSSALICLSALGIARGLSARQSVLLMIVAVAALSAKASTLAVVGVDLLVFASIWFVQLRGRLTSANRAKLAAIGSALAAALLLGVGMAFASGRIPNPMSSYGRYQSVGDTSYLSAGRAVAFLSQLDLFPFVYQFRTFWATFYNDAIQLPSVLYWFLALLGLGATLGLLARLYRASRCIAAGARPGVPRPYVPQLLFMAALILVQWLMSLLRYYLYDPPPSVRIEGWAEAVTVMQGRFLFPAIVPLALLFTWGLRGLVPARLERQSLALLVAVLIAVDLFALVTVLVGFYSWQH